MRRIILLAAIFTFAGIPSSGWAEEAQVTLQAKPEITCTKVYCLPENPCCNLCNHDNWQVARGDTLRRVELERGELPRFAEVYSCEVSEWGQLQVTGYWKDETFYAINWELSRPDFKVATEFTKEGWMAEGRLPIAYYLVEKKVLIGKRLSEIEAMLGFSSPAPGELEKASEGKAWYLRKHPPRVGMPTYLPFNYDVYLIVYFDWNGVADSARIYEKVSSDFQNVQPRN